MGQVPGPTAPRPPWDGSWVLPQDLRLTHRATALFLLCQKTVSQA